MNSNSEKKAFRRKVQRINNPAAFLAAINTEHARLAVINEAAVLCADAPCRNSLAMARDLLGVVINTKFNPAESLPQKPSFNTLSAYEYDMWREAGFFPDEAEEWSHYGIPPEMAAAWKHAGFKAKEADAWIRVGFLDIDKPQTLGCAHDARKWKKAGFTAAMAADWANFYCPKEAAKWIAAGFHNSIEAEAWWEMGFTAKQAMARKKKGKRSP